MSLDMRGHIDATFESTVGTRTARTDGSYVNGRYVDGLGSITTHSVNLQPLSEREIQNLQNGGERIKDTRKIYVNDGDLYQITPADAWTCEGVEGEFKTIRLDVRPRRSYCKAIVSRVDK